MEQQDRTIEGLLSQLDDYENRSRRNNLWIRGLPESVKLATLISTLLFAFSKMLSTPPFMILNALTEPWGQRILLQTNHVM